MRRKTCSDCDAKNDGERILCCACGAPLETTLYLRFIYGTSLVAVVADFALTRLGLLHAFSVPLAFELEVALLLVTYPLFKLATKRLAPRRRVSVEMGSTFSSRFDRAMVTAAIVLVLLFATGALRISGVPTELDPRLAGAKAVLDVAISIGGVLAIAAMLRDQGLAFFDLRVRNTYQARHLDD